MKNANAQVVVKSEPTSTPSSSQKERFSAQTKTAQTKAASNSPQDNFVTAQQASTVIKELCNHMKTCLDSVKEYTDNDKMIITNDNSASPTFGSSAASA